jgi:hypothetical protein
LKYIRQKKINKNSPWRISILLVDSKGNIIFSIQENFITSTSSLDDFHITYQGKSLSVIDKPNENFLKIDCKIIPFEKIGNYVNEIYDIAYKDDENFLNDQKQRESNTNSLLRNLIQYLTADRELRVIDITGKTGTEAYSINFGEAKQNFKTPFGAIAPGEKTSKKHNDITTLNYQDLLK